ncbi:MAG: response regulator [Euryarchaeota archaeon]|nr:response regulator [Euryarchaeota archaeon]
MSKILIVDDDRHTTGVLEKALRRSGFQVITAESATEGINRLVEEQPDLVLLDLVLPDMRGLQALDEISRLSPETKVIIISAFPSIGDVVEAMKLGASDVLVKPFNVDELVSIVKKTLEEARLERRIEAKISDTVIKALSNPIRKRIAFYLLHAGVRRFSEIARSTEMDDPSKLSFHLRVLIDAGIVCKNRAGQYSLTGDGRAIVERLLLRLEEEV